MKRILFLTFVVGFLYASPCMAEAFYNNFSAEENASLAEGSVLIRNIKYSRNMSLKPEASIYAAKLTTAIKDLNPKYLAEVIQTRPYEGNEKLPEKLNEILNNVSEYAGIPYYSVRAKEWYDLYSSATITDEKTDGNRKEMNADLEMEPFGTVKEFIEIESDSEQILYIATNQNKLRYKDEFDCVWPQRMKMCILLFRDGDNWILYGIGGVNAPRIPFFTERIETSFMNRITTFCNFIFKKI